MCPLQQDCSATAQGIAETLPIKFARAERPVRYGFAFVVQSTNGRILLRQRPAAGLLGGMLEVPSTPWEASLPPVKEALRSAPVSADWWQVPGPVVHVFTHFRLELNIYRAIVEEEDALTFWADPPRCRWVKRKDLHGEALPSVMRKVIAHGLGEPAAAALSNRS